MKQFLLVAAFLAAAVPLSAQQNIGFRDKHSSEPQVNPDNSVTFRLSAPDATSVEVIGDWQADRGREKMSRDSVGVWTFTTAPLPSDMYFYRFRIDGVVTADPGNAITRRDVGTTFNIFFVPGGNGDKYMVSDVPHGDALTTWYHSATAASDRRITVYLPAAYLAESARHFPVLYLLHGSGGDETAWTDLGSTTRILDNMIASGEIEPMIVVMPNGNITKTAAPGETSENLSYRPAMTDRLPGSYKNGIYELSFHEIVDFVDARFRTVADGDHRAVAGLSMGGFHSLYIAINHPGCFRYVGLFSAGLDTSGLDMSIPAYSDFSGKVEAFKRAGCNLFWIACGRDDSLFSLNRELSRQLSEAGVENTFHESARGHLWSNWRSYLLQFLPQLFRVSHN